MGAAGSAGAKPDSCIDLVEAAPVITNNVLAGFHALKVTRAPVAKMSFKRIGQHIQWFHTCARPGEALEDDLSRFAGVGFVSHPRHKGRTVLNDHSTPEAVSGRLEDA